ncbi:hypothetical protein ACFP51_17195 [Streptomyces pratens]|uniref:DDE domain-containing protein n=1 Tax=Streptomyces pratens TaxID=887456 RepID=A0ABW1LWC8_9ACTN
MRLHFCFPLSFREVEELRIKRDVIVPHGTVRHRCTKFGQGHANSLHRRPRPGDERHLDEAFVKIAGGPKYLWRAVNADDAQSMLQKAVIRQPEVGGLPVCSVSR